MTKPFIPCRTCASRKGPAPGLYYVPSPSGGQTQVVECVCHKKWRLSIKLSSDLKRSNLWVDWQYDIKSYKGVKSQEDLQALQSYVDKFEELKSQMVYAYGPNGTQKTTLLQWVGVELTKKGYSIYYTLMESLTNLLLPNFDKPSEERDSLVQHILKCDLLIVDESFDLKSMTIYKSGYQIPYLYKFLKERFELEGKGIVFVSNNKAEQMPPLFGTSFKDFVQRNTRESQLSFLDNYTTVMENSLNPRGIFTRG